MSRVSSVYILTQRFHYLSGYNESYSYITIELALSAVEFYTTYMI